MPPSHHSSSSHSGFSRSFSSGSRSSSSFSSRSSSHSNSSHSFRSSYSSSCSSSPSRSSFSSPSSHSRSSHSSGSVGGSRTSGLWIPPSSYRRSYSDSYSNRVLPRVRKNQPNNYRPSASELIYGLKHDYYYLKSACQDGDKVYKPGYYDENGDYYAGIDIPDTETYCHCEYCGTIHKISGIEGSSLTCENCGAPLTISIIDKLRTSNVGVDNLQYEEDDSDYDSPTTMSSKSKRLIAGIILFILVALSVGVIFTVLRPMLQKSNNNSGQVVNQQLATQTVADSIFVQPIGRRCFMDSEGNYYDQITDCYFWFNTDINPPQWQYWYEDISSEYGNYGWMEYDDAEGKWYIEQSSGNWIELPEKYLSERLWHFDSAFEYQAGQAGDYQVSGSLVYE